MAVNTNAPTQQELEPYFKDADPVAPGTFEFALVLGGSGSAGAYIAGVVDFIVEALDEWTKARDAKPTDQQIPPHKTVLKAIAGTSGGGINGSILAKSLAYDFPHVAAAGNIPGGDTGNPFYDLWTRQDWLKGFLDTADVDAGKLVSLLNGAPIDAAADFVVNYPDPALKIAPRAAPRAWVAQPLQLFLTLTNVSGLPYRTSMGGAHSEVFVNHGDWVRAAAIYPPTPYPAARPDEFVLGVGANVYPNGIAWKDFAEFAKGTSAFPVGFPPRQLSRPAEQLRWRVRALPGDTDNPAARLIPLEPYWDQLRDPKSGAVPDAYSFLSVDGGVVDNEPIELARTALAGTFDFAKNAIPQNPRDPTKASRAVVLVDPFAGVNTLNDMQVSLPDLLGDLIKLFMQQTRYDSSDLMLALDETVFSRFMVTPPLMPNGIDTRIASGGLMAFMGFACRDFQRYDYFLGRANAQSFLRNEFVLDAGNPLFAGWSPALKANPQFLVTAGGKNFLPVIPLIGTAAVEQSVLPWPAGKLDPEIYRDAIEERFKAIVEFEGSSGLVSRIGSWLIAHLGESSVADFIIGKMTDSLKCYGLDGPRLFSASPAGANSAPAPKHR